jgi:hypothetical protein
MLIIAGEGRVVNQQWIKETSSARTTADPRGFVQIQKSKNHRAGDIDVHRKLVP